MHGHFKNQKYLSEIAGKKISFEGPKLLTKTIRASLIFECFYCASIYCGHTMWISYNKYTCSLDSPNIIFL